MQKVLAYAARVIPSAVLLASTLSAAASAAPVPQCVGETLGVAMGFVRAPGMALAGDEFAVVRRMYSTGRQIDLYRRTTQGEYVIRETVTDFPHMPGFVKSMTFDGERIQFYAGGTPSILVELEKDAGGAWQSYETELSGQRTHSGEVLVRDGERWAAVTWAGHNTLVVDVIERNGAGRLECVATTELETNRAFGFECTASIALDHDQLVVRSGAERRGAVQVLQRSSTGEWTRAGYLEQPDGTSTYYGGGIDIQGDVATVVRQIVGANGQSVVHVYQRDATSIVGWTMVQSIRRPVSDYSTAGFRYIWHANLTGDRLVIGGVNRGVTQVLRREASGALRFSPETTISGMGSRVLMGPGYLLGESLDREIVAVDLGDLVGHERMAVCIPAGDRICVDPSHSLELTLSVRTIHAPHLSLIADVEGAAPGAAVYLLGSNSLLPTDTGAGRLCVGPTARRTTIPLAFQGPGYHSGVAELTRLPIQGGMGSAVDGETWYFQGLGLGQGGQRALSSAIAVSIRL